MPLFLLRGGCAEATPPYATPLLVVCCVVGAEAYYAAIRHMRRGVYAIDTRASHYMLFSAFFSLLRCLLCFAFTPFCSLIFYAAIDVFFADIFFFMPVLFVDTLLRCGCFCLYADDAYAAMLMRYFRYADAVIIIFVIYAIIAIIIDFACDAAIAAIICRHYAFFAIIISLLYY